MTTLMGEVRGCMFGDAVRIVLTSSLRRYCFWALRKPLLFLCSCRHGNGRSFVGYTPCACRFTQRFFAVK